MRTGHIRYTSGYAGLSVYVSHSRRRVELQLPLAHPEQRLDGRKVLLVDSKILPEFTSGFVRVEQLDDGMGLTVLRHEN
jgi:hypothetical protein